METAIADFTEREHWVIRTTLQERWGEQDIPLHAADAEIRLRPDDAEGTPCPALYWQVNDCSFIVFKTGEARYRCQFFYNDLQQMGPDVTEYDELAECVVQLLQTQADHARMTGRIETPAES